MSNLVKVLGLLLACIVLTFCDVYMHSPRGSNNRLNERSANRRTNNRLFDSQVKLFKSFKFQHCS